MGSADLILLDAKEGDSIYAETSEIKISVVIAAKYTELAVRVLHDALIPPAK